jgi:hypothetical protein
MLIPSPVAIQSKKTVIAKLDHSNIKRAATAPIWRNAKVITVGQFIFWPLPMSTTGVFTDPSSVERRYFSKLTRNSRAICKSCVIYALCLSNPLRLNITLSRTGADYAVWSTSTTSFDAPSLPPARQTTATMDSSDFSNSELPGSMRSIVGFPENNSGAECALW